MKKMTLKTAEKKHLFNELIDAYLLDCQRRRLREGTIKHYKDSAHQITKYLNDNLIVEGINENTFYNFIEQLENNGGLNEVSIYSYARDFKTLLRFGMKKEWIKNFKITLKEADKEPTKTYSELELSKLLKKPNMKHSSYSEYKNWVITNFLLSTGVRQHSLQEIKISDLDLENRIVNIRVTKNHKPLILPLNSSIVSILNEYLEYRGGEKDDYLFCNVYGEKLNKSTLYHGMYEYNKNRGVDTTGLHRYRHTFAKMWILNGGNVVVLSKILGHSSLEITQNYINLLVSDIQNDVEEFDILKKFKKEYKKLR